MTARNATSMNHSPLGLVAMALSVLAAGAGGISRGYPSAIAVLFLMALSPSAYADWHTTTGPRPPRVASLAEGTTTLFLGAFQHDTGGPVYRSLDEGQTWLLSNGATPVRLFPHHDSIVYGGGVYVGLWRSVDDGLHWSQVTGGLPTNGSGFVLDACGNAIFASATGGTPGSARLYRSTNDGANWWALTGGLPVPTLASDACCLSDAVLVAVGPEIYRSTDVGATWAPLGLGLPSGALVDRLTERDGALWAGVSGDATSFGVYRSTDAGDTWTRVGLALAPPQSFRFYDLTAGGSHLYTVIWGSEPFDTGGLGLHRSTDGGTTWTRVWNGFEDPAQSVLKTSENLFVGTDTGPYRSTDEGASWSDAGTGAGRTVDTPAIIARGETFLAGTAQAGGPSDVWRSTDDGAHWTSAESGLPQNVHAAAFLNYENKSFVGLNGASSGVYRSTDAGVSWTPSTTGIPGGAIIYALHAHEGVLFTGAYEALYRSIDQGQSWAAVSGGLPIPPVRGFASDGPTLYAATSSAGVFRSSDDGLTWSAVNAGLPALQVHALAQVGGDLLAGLAAAGVYRFDGTSWSPSGLSGETVNTFLMLQGILIAGGTALAYSHDDGATWTSFEEGLVTQAEIHSIAANHAQLVVGSNYGIFLRTRDELPVPASIDPTISNTGSLLSSWPNPFRDRTTISYRVSEPSRVRVRVYDVVGRSVLSPFDQWVEAGRHELVVAGDALPAGVYSVELRAGTEVDRIQITRSR